MFFLLNLFLFFNLSNLSAQTIKIDWNEKFRKEVRVDCSYGDIFCYDLCGISSRCTLEEDICKNCIGTGLKMYMILSELGKSINTSPINLQMPFLLDFLRHGHYVTLSGSDAYNILDSFGSIKAFKKFEALCPEESQNQILFLETHPNSREILNPSFIYCEFEDQVLFRFIELNPDIRIDKISSMGLF